MCVCVCVCVCDMLDHSSMVFLRSCIIFYCEHLLVCSYIPITHTHTHTHTQTEIKIHLVKCIGSYLRKSCMCDSNRDILSPSMAVNDSIGPIRTIRKIIFVRCC